MSKVSKRRARTPIYSSPNQLTIVGFESPFERNLNPDNRWVKLAHLLPWDSFASIYYKAFPKKDTGRPGLSPRVVLGSLIIKHMCNLDDRETVDQITENIYMQYFLGYPSFSDAPPFDASLFVEFRKRLGKDQLQQMNALVIKLGQQRLDDEQLTDDQDDPGEGEAKEMESHLAQQTSCNSDQDPSVDSCSAVDTDAHKGSMIIDATVCPQDIAYPTDLDILNDARMKSEEFLDCVFLQASVTSVKPCNYRQKARKDYLRTAQKKKKSRKEIRKAIGRQLGYLGRNIRSINNLLDECAQIPFDHRQYKYWLVIQHSYQQQLEMYNARSHSIDHRIVSIHQPHVPPIVRGKAKAKVEFGAKINVMLVDGFTQIADMEWEA